MCVCAGRAAIRIEFLEHQMGVQSQSAVTYTSLIRIPTCSLLLFCSLSLPLYHAIVLLVLSVVACASVAIVTEFVLVWCRVQNIALSQPYFPLACTATTALELSPMCVCV